MPGGDQILLLTRDQETTRAVEQAAQLGLPAAVRVVPFQELREISSRLERNGVSLLVADVGPQPMVTLAQLEPLMRKFSGMRLVVLCAELDKDVLLEAMQIGARHCLVKSGIARELPNVLRRLMQDTPEPPASSFGPLGRLVTVLAASGGCGATTVAVNLAEELRRASERPSLLVDLDQHFGAVATYLGLKGRYGVADVLAYRGAIDAQLVRSTALTHADGLQVLISPASVDSTAPAVLAWDRLELMLAVCKQSYHTTVIDAPRVSPDVAARLAKESLLTLVVFELAVVDIRSARNVLDALRQRGVPAASVLPVANRWHKRNPMISLEDAQKALPGATVVHLSNDYESAMRSINLGKTLAEVAPRSPLRKDVQELAAQVEKLAGPSRLQRKEA